MWGSLYSHRYFQLKRTGIVHGLLIGIVESAWHVSHRVVRSVLGFQIAISRNNTSCRRWGVIKEETRVIENCAKYVFLSLQQLVQLPLIRYSCMYKLN